MLFSFQAAGPQCHGIFQIPPDIFRSDGTGLMAGQNLFHLFSQGQKFFLAFYVKIQVSMPAE